MNGRAGEQDVKLLADNDGCLEGIIMRNGGRPGHSVTGKMRHRWIHYHQKKNTFISHSLKLTSSTGSCRPSGTPSTIRTYK